MHKTYVRGTDKGLPFPMFPPAATIMNKGFATSTGDLVDTIYLSDSPGLDYTKYIWLEQTFSREQLSVILNNSYNGCYRR